MPVSCLSWRRFEPEIATPWGLTTRAGEPGGSGPLHLRTTPPASIAATFLDANAPYAVAEPWFPSAPTVAYFCSGTPVDPGMNGTLTPWVSCSRMIDQGQAGSTPSAWLAHIVQWPRCPRSNAG